MTEYILAIDQGTTSTRAILFDRDGRAVQHAQQQLRQYYPAPGWVEHSPDEIWDATVQVCRDASDGHTPSAIGITNQRETTVIWDRHSGKAIGNAIVWQDRRTAARCTELAPKYDDLVRERSGLLVDSYFSASKIAWMLDQDDGLRERAARGDVLFGTVDSWLLWNMSDGGLHATDATNACRTMLYNISSGDWDDDLLALWNIPRAMLPEIRDSAGHFTTNTKLCGVEVPVTGVAGDQQAATFGQACFKPGMLKSTYGTGAFLLLNTGRARVRSDNRLLTTVAYQLGGKRTYALEGSIFSAGSVVQWLRDELNMIDDASESEDLARIAPDDSTVYVIPAFTGLGAPYWDPDARGGITGLTRDSGREHIARAALESVGYQTRDLFESMAADGAPSPRELRVDGGMVVNDWMVQFLADILGVNVRRPRNIETTALGAAFLAGLGAGIYSSTDDLAPLAVADRTFTPEMDDQLRERKFAGWRSAIGRIRTR